MTRKELLTSREYWVTLISIQLWNIHGCVERLSDKYDKMAEKVVDDNFMSRIIELSDPKELTESVKSEDVVRCEFSRKELGIIAQSLHGMYGENAEYLKWKKDEFSQKEIPKEMTLILAIIDKIYGYEKA